MPAFPNRAAAVLAVFVLSIAAPARADDVLVDALETRMRDVASSGIELKLVSLVSRTIDIECEYQAESAAISIEFVRDGLDLRDQRAMMAQAGEPVFTIDYLVRRQVSAGNLSARTSAAIILDVGEACQLAGAKILGSL